MKKLSIILSIILCLANVTAFASPEVTFVSDTRALDISGMAQPGEVVSIIVTNPGITSDLLNGESVSEQLVLLYELEANEDGVYDGKFTLPQTAEAGEYTVYDNLGGFTSFYYADEGEISECISAVKNADEFSIEEILKKYTDEKKILGLDLHGDYESYKDIANRLMVSLIKENVPSEISDISQSFSKSCEGAKFSMGDKDEIIEVLDTNTLGIFIDGDLDKNSVVDIFVKVRKDNVSSIYDVIKSVREACAIVSVNSSTKGELTNVLEKYNDVLDLPLDGEYAKLEKVEVNKALYHRNFDSVTDIKTAFVKAVKKVSDDDSSKPSSSGSSNYSGGTASKIEVTNSPSGIDSDMPNYFDDLSGCEWAKDYINDLASKGIVNGVGAKTFAPDKAVTREEYLKMLLGAFGTPLIAGESTFDDTDADAWYTPYIVTAVNMGVVKGIDEKTFGIGNVVTREQMAVMTVRMFEYYGKMLTGGNLNFADSEKVSEYAVDAVSKMVSAGIINGMDNNCFVPAGNLTRAQAAKVISLTMMKAGA